jgi:hypothetical protein
MNENHVALKIFGYGSLSGLSQKLQLVPTKTAEKGEEYAVGPKKLKRKYEWSYWEYRWSRTEDRFIGDLVEEFVAAVIEPKKAVLKEVISTCSAELSIAQYYVAGCNPGLHLSSTTVSVLGEIGADVDVDVYCLAEDK